MKWHMCMIYVLDIKMYYFLFLLIYRSTISLLMLLISKKNIKLSECHSKLQYDSKSLDNVSTLSDSDPNDDKGPVSQR